MSIGLYVFRCRFNPQDKWELPSSLWHQGSVPSPFNQGWRSKGYFLHSSSICLMVAFFVKVTLLFWVDSLYIWMNYYGRLYRITQHLNTVYLIELIKLSEHVKNTTCLALYFFLDENIWNHSKFTGWRSIVRVDKFVSFNCHFKFVYRNVVKICQKLCFYGIT